MGVYGNAEAKEDFKRNSTDDSWWYAMDKNNGDNSKIVYDGEEHGNAVQLIYFMGQKSEYGDDFKWDLNGTIPKSSLPPAPGTAL